jgi:hypothetical protein
MIKNPDKMVPISIHFDNIIYKLQQLGGATIYWDEITSRISSNMSFSTENTNGSKLNRFFPVMSSSEIFHSSHFRTSSNLRKISIGIFCTRGKTKYLAEKASYRSG